MMKNSTWVGLLVALVAYLLNTVMLYTTFTSRGKFVIWDFHPVFVAGQYVLRGANPYSDEVTRAIHLLDYGRPARPDEDPQSFAYPAFLAYLIAPLALLPLPWAQAAWLSLLQVVAIAEVGLIIANWNWPNHRLARIGLVLWCLLFYPIVWGLILGQFSLFLSILPVLVVWAVGRQRDELAGAAVGLMILKPQIAFLFVPGVIVWALARRRWRLVAWASASIAFMLIFPMMFHPRWMLDFVNRLNEYNAYSPFTAPAIVAVQNCCRPVASYLAPMVVVAIVGIVAFGWWAAVRAGSASDFMWAVGVTLIATTLIAPQISIVNQAILLLPIIGELKLLSTKGWGGILLMVVALIVWGAGLWALSLMPPISTAKPRYPVEHQILSPIVPLSLGALWLRQRKILGKQMGKRGE